MWNPEIDTAGARYLAIAEALSGDVKSGRLRPGDRLPTHRDLAYRLGVTVGTVTRAYAEAARRGLVGGEVGRGTYVRDTRPPSFSAESHDCGARDTAPSQTRPLSFHLTCGRS